MEQEVDRRGRVQTSAETARPTAELTDVTTDEAAAGRLCDRRIALLRDLGLLAPQTERDVREQRAVTAITASYGIPPDEGRLALLEAVDLRVRFQFAVEDGDSALAQALCDRAGVVLTNAYGFAVDATKAFRSTTRRVRLKDVEAVPGESEHR